VGTGVQGVHCTPPSSGLVPPVPPSQRFGLCLNFKQTTLTTRFYKVCTNLYPPLTKTFRRAWYNRLMCSTYLRHSPHRCAYSIRSSLLQYRCLRLCVRLLFSAHWDVVWVWLGWAPGTIHRCIWWGSTSHTVKETSLEVISGHAQTCPQPIFLSLCRIAAYLLRRSNRWTYTVTSPTLTWSKILGLQSARTVTAKAAKIAIGSKWPIWSLVV